MDTPAPLSLSLVKAKNQRATRITVINVGFFSFLFSMIQYISHYCDQLSHGKNLVLEIGESTSNNSWHPTNVNTSSHHHHHLYLYLYIHCIPTNVNTSSRRRRHHLYL